MHEAALAAKVSPIPIGLSFTCTQLPEWRDAVAYAAARPLKERKLAIAVTFDPSGRDRRRTALKELASSRSDNLVRKRRLPTRQLWQMIAQYAFVAAPASRGQDTMRFWETLALGSIPIVQAGPLDVLYAQVLVTLRILASRSTAFVLRRYRASSSPTGRASLWRCSSNGATSW